MSRKQGKRIKPQNQQGDLRKYYTLGLPLLALMALVAVLGVIATIVARHFL